MMGRYLARHNRHQAIADPGSDGTADAPPQRAAHTSLATIHQQGGPTHRPQQCQPLHDAEPFTQHDTGNHGGDNRRTTNIKHNRQGHADLRNRSEISHLIAGKRQATHHQQQVMAGRHGKSPAPTHQTMPYQQQGSGQYQAHGADRQWCNSQAAKQQRHHDANAPPRDGC